MSYHIGWILAVWLCAGCSEPESNGKRVKDTSEGQASTVTTDNSPTASSPTTSTTSATDDCIPSEEAPAMPYRASEYAALCEPYVGVPPTVDCGDGVPIPIEVDGVEVFEDQTRCDNTDFKGTCTNVRQCLCKGNFSLLVYVSMYVCMPPLRSFSL